MVAVPGTELPHFVQAEGFPFLSGRPQTNAVHSRICARRRQALCPGLSAESRGPGKRGGSLIDGVDHDKLAPRGPGRVDDLAEG
jgi:hypothetical protein